MERRRHDFVRNLLALALVTTTTCAIVPHSTAVADDNTGKTQQIEIPDGITLPTMSVSSDLARGLFLLRQGNYVDAVPPLRSHVKVDATPGLPTIYLARALSRSGKSAPAIALLTTAAATADLKAIAEFELASHYLREEQPTAAIAALRRAVAAEYSPSTTLLRKDSTWKAALRNSEIAKIIEGARSPRRRFRELCDRGDKQAEVEIEELWRALRTRWEGEAYAPVYLIHDEIHKHLTSGSTDSKSLLRASCGARVADRVFETQEFSRWVSKLAALDAKGRKKYAENWKQLRKSPQLFRAHRFRKIVELYAPVLESTEEMGDVVGVTAALSVLGLGRYCLVEYKVKGFDLGAQWLASWECYRRAFEIARRLGQIDEEAGALQNFLYLLHKPADAATRRFSRSPLTPLIFYATVAAEERLPRGEHDSSWYAKALGW
ncbi:MAG: hypothetical protein AAF581_21835 [Planctomycetota bacterium]